MMQQMRDKMKIIMLVTAVAFVGLMVFEWGMDLSGRSSAQASGGELGRVNREPVSYDEFLRTYRNLYDEQQRAKGDPLTASENRQVEQAAWEQLVMQRLVAQELRRRGITVTDEEVRQAARFAPPPQFYENELFQTNGQFDLAKYQQFLASPSVDQQLLFQLEAYYRDLIPRSKLYQQVTAGLYIPDGELWRMWRERSETARVRYLALDPQTLVADAAIALSDKEIQATYESQRADFARPARASIRLVTIDRSPTAADTAAALERARNIRQQIVGGADFAEVARRESADSASAAQGGSLGKFRRGQMVPAFDRAAWSLPIGQVSEPVLTQYGYHILEVESRKDDEAQARHILVRIRRTEENENALLVLADSLETLGEELPLAAAAERLGLRVRSAELTPELPIVAGLGRVDDGADWAFREAEPGEVSAVYDENPAFFYMLELVERTPEGILPLAEATPEIRHRLLTQKKLEHARRLGRELVDRIRQGQTLDQVAQPSGLDVREAGPFTRLDFVPGLGRLNAAIGAAFGLRPGQVSGLVEAEGALFILQGVERTEPDRQQFEQQRESIRTRLIASLQEERWAQFLAALKEQAKIVDNRKQLLRQAADQEEPARATY